MDSDIHNLVIHSAHACFIYGVPGRVWPSDLGIESNLNTGRAGKVPPGTHGAPPRRAAGSISKIINEQNTKFHQPICAAALRKRKPTRSYPNKWGPY